jgi:hypothetical protein
MIVWTKIHISVYFLPGTHIYNIYIIFFDPRKKGTSIYSF